MQALEDVPRLCRHCGGSLADSEEMDEQGDIWCRACGIVDRVQSVFDVDNWGGPSNSRSTMTVREVEDESAVDRQHKKDLINVMHQHLPNSKHDATIRMWTQFKTALRKSNKKLVEVAAAIRAVIYIIACYNDLALRLEQLQTRECTKPKISKMVRQISEVCELQEYPRIRPKAMIEFIVEKLGVQPPMRSRLMTTALDIHACGSSAWLMEGRPNAAIAGASVLMAAHVLKLKAVDAESIASTCDIGKSTLTIRLREFRDAFLQAMLRLPWHKLITKSNYTSYLPFVLEFKQHFFDTEMSAPSALT